MFQSAALGSVTNFDHEHQEWIIYRDRLKQWFIVNEFNEKLDKDGVKRRAVLLSALSESTYQLASNLTLPRKLDSVGFDELVKILDDHFLEKRCSFAERQQFYSAVQRSGESHAQWAARLRGLAAHCDFKNLEEALLDKFVMGMLHGHEREKIFSMEITDLTLSKAVDVAERTRCARIGATAAGSSSGTSNEALFKISNGHKHSSPTVNLRNSEKCLVCGRNNHKSDKCRYANYKCQKCQKKGHLKKMCKRVNYVEQGEVTEDDDGEFFNIRSRSGAPMTEMIFLNNIRLKFEVDSGSAVTAISENTYNLHFSSEPLSPSTKNLRSYTGGRINSLGIVRLPVTYEGRTEMLDIYVIQGGGPPLLGRDFISLFNLELTSIKYCEKLDGNDVEKMLSQYKDIFADRLGCFNKGQIKLHLKDNAKPVFHKARPVPFALKEKLDAEIDRMLQLGIIEPVSYSEYASPIVPVLKRDGSVRICADYSQTLNKQLLVETYPLPTVQELFSKLHGGEQYTKLDMSSAYNQLILDDTENVTCINTHRGLFKYKRLVFGLASAPAIFQRAIESILGLEGVLIYLDDILITGIDKAQHMARLKSVLHRFQEAGLILRKEKCEFFKDELSYLGYIINKSGIRKSPEKVKAIVEAPIPTNLNQLQSFLGLVNYYRNFVPGASSMLSPLYELLKKGIKWSWTKKHDKAFNEIKNCLVSERVLAHFDPKATIILTVDAGPTGLGAILSLIDKDGLERPVSFASRTLSAAEKNYSQIQKEATAIIFGVRRYHQFLYARSEPFILRTDHKPLVSIFGPNRGIPEVTANRLQRYAIFLAAYNYRIEYVKSANNSADYLSRATIPTSVVQNTNGGAVTADAREERAAYINFVVEGSLPIALEQLCSETKNDATLSKVMKYVQTGWPRKVNDKKIKPYFNCRLQLSIEKGCLMRGHKVIIPEKLQGKVLSELHSSHFGIVKTKAEARSRLWFPGIDAAIEQLIAACAVCVSQRPSPPRAPLAPWPYPAEPFYRIHIDFLGPIQNQMYLVIVDAHTKWLECYNMKNNISSSAVINKLYDFMSRFGIFRVLVSDNGSSLTSDEFAKFCSLNKILHLRSPIYNPSSNGQAESFVKIVKKGIRCALVQERSQAEITNKLLKYLFDYRNTVHSTTGKSPAELVYGRKLRSRLDLINPRSSSSSVPHRNNVVLEKQFLQSKYYGGCNNKSFRPGEDIHYKKYSTKNKFIWTRGTIVKRIGNVVYLLKDRMSGVELRRHKNQIISCPTNETRDNLDLSFGEESTDVQEAVSEDSQPVSTSTSTSTGSSSAGPASASVGVEDMSAGATSSAAATSSVESRASIAPGSGAAMLEDDSDESPSPPPVVVSSRTQHSARSPISLRRAPRVDYKKFYR